MLSVSPEGSQVLLTVPSLHLCVVGMMEEQRQPS